MTHPEWTLQYKKKNTEIRNIKGRYYLYNITSKWDGAKGRNKKVTLGQVGVLNEEYGLIPTGMSRKGRIPKGKTIYKDDTMPPLETNFLDDFMEIDDPKSQRNQLFSVEEILLLTLCAVICGAEGWQDVEDYGKLKITHLRQFLEYKNGIPSDDTIRRFYRHINPDKFEQLFRDWVGTIAKGAQANVIAIDGKSSRHSFNDNTNMLHVISAYCANARIVLGQEKVSEKSNEITAIPKMLEWLDVKGHIVTIDAMGCQVQIAKRILEKEGDYIFSLKGNQGNLNDDVREFFEDKDLTASLSSYTDYDKAHGRIETRECWVDNNVDWLKKMNPNWNSIRSIIKVQSVREMKKETTKEVRYYISSLDDIPEQMIKHIRSHWSIENNLHWILDMSFNEDYSRIRKGNAPYAMAIIRHVALNLLQTAKKDRQSIKRLRKMCGWNEETLNSVILKKSS